MRSGCRSVGWGAESQSGDLCIVMGNAVMVNERHARLVIRLVTELLQNWNTVCRITDVKFITMTWEAWSESARRSRCRFRSRFVISNPSSSKDCLLFFILDQGIPFPSFMLHRPLLRVPNHDSSSSELLEAECRNHVQQE